MVESDSQNTYSGPEWLDKKFFEKILRKSEQDGSITVQSLQIRPTGKEGEHNGSIMYRVSISFTKLDSIQGKKSLIVKTIPFIEKNQKETLDYVNGVFETEIQIYDEVIPKFESLLTVFGDKTLLGGKCLYSALEPEKVLVFEDLTDKNYKTVSNFGGHWTIAKKATEKLAKIHALSYKIHSEGGKDFHKFSKHCFANEKLADNPPFHDGFNNFMEMLKDHEEFQEFIPRFEKIIDGQPLQKIEKLIKSFFYGLPANVCVLNHGDYHIKNVMYLENDSGEIEDVKLIDFQLCIFGPAVIDLIYLLYTFLDDKDRLERRKEIFEFYFNIFTETLEKSEFSGKYPTVSDFESDFLNFKEYEIMIAVCLLPIISELQRNKLVKPEQMNTDEFRASLYKNPEYVDFMTNALPEYLKMGLLD